MNWFRPSFDPLSAADCELVVRLRSGDEACWRELYRRHQDRLYRYALRMTGSAATASDITQETFVAFLEQAHRYDPAQAPLGAWLLGIARNRVRKSFTATAAWEPLEDAPPPEAPGHDPLTSLTHAEQLAAVRVAVDALPPAFREVVVLIEFEEMSYEETAAVLGVPAGTVRSRLHRARALLQQSLSAQGVAR
ncbi:MAG: sigma-70 family RNA polymerase sigma factor [Acidobacteria bacterium]|nr:sigma-70 family RNA polymerase sigma factor [Acidobacteriota bacterium]